MKFPRFRYSLRTLLIVVTLAGVGLAWWTRPVTRVFSPQRAGVIVHEEGHWRPAPGGDKSTKIFARSGAYRLYTVDGRLLVEGRFVGTRPVGLWRAYGHSGERLFEGRCEEGERTGPWVSYHPDGARVKDGPPPPRVVCKIEEGQLEGEAIGYWPDGSLCFRGTYQRGERTGPWEFAHPGGRKRAQGAFESDRAHGPWNYWDSEGRELPAKEFVDGREIQADETLLNQLAARLEGGGPIARADAAERLADCGTGGTKRLAAALSDDDVLVRRLAARALERQGPRALPAVYELTGALDDTDDEIRRIALVLLARMGPKADAAFDRLGELAAQASGGTRHRLLAVRTIIRPRDLDAFRELLSTYQARPSLWESAPGDDYLHGGIFDRDDSGRDRIEQIERIIDVDKKPLGLAALDMLKLAPWDRDRCMRVLKKAIVLEDEDVRAMAAETMWRMVDNLWQAERRAEAQEIEAILKDLAENDQSDLVRRQAERMARHW